MITWEDIPGNEQIALRKAFDENQKIVNLRSKANLYHKTGHYSEALMINQQIDKFWNQIKSNHVKSYQENLKETVKLSEIGLSEEQTQKVVENILIVFMCCDIIETANLNANEVLKNFNSSYSMDNFNDLAELIRKVKLELEFLKRETSYMEDFVWGDNCDKQYEMIRNKARSIMRKKNNLNHWGESLKKYLEEHKDD